MFPGQVLSSFNNRVNQGSRQYIILEILIPASVAIHIDIAGEVLEEEDDSNSSEYDRDNQCEDDDSNIFCDKG